MSSCRILVIDPSPTVRRVVQLVLGRQQHDVLATGSAEEGASWLATEALDLLIVDSALYKAGSPLAAVASRQGLGSRILLIVNRESDLDARTTPHLFKPFTPERLEKAVVQLLSDAGDAATDGSSELPPVVAGTSVARGFDIRALGVRGQPVLWCRLSAIPLPELLQLMRFQAGDPQLTVSVAKRKVCITMRAGQIDFVQAEGLSRGYRLGSYLIRVEAISEEDLEAFFDAGRAAGQPLGKALVAAGMVTPAQLHQAVALQNSELIYEVLRWVEGEAVVATGGTLSELEAETGLGLTVEELLTEGLRRVDEWQHLEQNLPPMDAVLEPNLVVINGFDLNRLAPAEREALARFRGGATLRGVLEDSEKNSYEMCQAVHLLIGSRILRARPEAGA